MSIVRVFLCLLLAVLVGCDGDKPEAPQPQAPARKEIQAPVAVPPPVAVPEAVEPVPAAPPVESPAVAPKPTPPAAPRTPVASPQPKASAPAAPQPVAPLDLSLPDELLERLPGEEPLQAVEPQPLLPPLFGDQAQEPQSFELGGRLITNEGPAAADEDSWHELEGAELELRFRR